jgi:Domain of unknown function (DUF3471)
MKATIHPGVFLCGCVLFCALWLWLDPVEPLPIPTSTPRTARPARASITLDPAILERYVGHYEGRADFTVDISIKNGSQLWAQSPATVPFEMLATSEREFFLLLSPEIDVNFRLDGSGAVTGFDATTPYGPLSLDRVR